MEPEPPSTTPTTTTTTTTAVLAHVPSSRVDDSAPLTAADRDQFSSEAADFAPRSSGGAPGIGVGGKKRGRPPRSQVKVGGMMEGTVPTAAKRAKKEDEDVCFICFDGGTLVLCDRRDCPKAYHPACVKRDEAFFRGRVRWNCGWHLCNSCQRNALFMCYTCTYSLCKGCVKQADIFCVRRNKGFCKTCMTTIMLIENVAQGNKESAQVDFDDKTSWEYLFKVYWVLLKQKENLTLDELIQASNPWKESGLIQKDDSSGTINASTLRATRQLECNVPKRRKIQRQTVLPHKDAQELEKVDTRIPLVNGVSDWASKELMEFVKLMRNGDTSALSQFDVQALLLEYIRKNNLRDPRRKCQIICDHRLEHLFGKERVGHFEMLKLLEYHFKGDNRPNGTIQAAVANPVTCQVEIDGSGEVIQTTNKDKKRQAYRKLDEKAGLVNLADYAAIDVHNMNLIYLKRSLIENLLEDSEKFHDKVVGSIVRIRISGTDQKPDNYRLVRVVGTGKATEQYKSGNKTAAFMLKILNLSKIEDVAIDAVSNQEFSEDECRRLRQSMKCGLVARMTVGEIQEKAMALQTVRVNDLLEAEKLRLNHLRDRASEMGHRKELRECVEKLELLNKPEERQRRINEIPEVHADPRMDPTYESDEETEQPDIKMQDAKKSAKLSYYNVKGVGLTSSQGGGITPTINRVKTIKIKSPSWEDKRTFPMRSQSVREESVSGSNDRDCESPQTLEGADAVSRILVELRNGVDRRAEVNHNATIASTNPYRLSSDVSMAPSSSGMVVSDNKELEKIWHYQDPSGKIQGPFCMLQLRKWNSNGYFPLDLRIWRADETQARSILLTDALTGSQSGVGLSTKSDLNWTYQQQNLGSCYDLNQAATSSSPEEQSRSTHSIGEEKVSPNDQSPEQKGQFSPEKTSVDSVAASNSSSASVSTSVVESDCRPEVENSELPSPTPKVKIEDLKAETTQGEQGDVSVVEVQNSGSCEGSSSAGLKFLDLPSPTPELQHKDLERPAVENEESVCDDIPAQVLGTNAVVASCGIEISDIQRLDSVHVPVAETQPSVASHVPETQPSVASNVPETQPSVASNVPETQPSVASNVPETQPSVASNVPGQSSRTSWGTISVGTHFSDLPAAASDQESLDLRIHEVVNNQHVASNISCQGSVLSWSTASSLVGSVVQLPDITGPWSGYSAMPAKPILEQLDVGLVLSSSMRQTEPGSDHNASTSESCQLGHSPANVDYASRWHGMEPIELSTLGDESVSDLLSEVEAMESLHGLISPSSRMNMDDSIDSPGHDCFSPLVGLSPPLDLGKHDAMSSTCDTQFHSHPIGGDGSHGGFTIDINDFPKTSGAHTSASPEVEADLNVGFLQLFTQGHQPANVPRINTALHAPMVGGEVKPVYHPLHQQNFVSQAHAPAPVSPLLTLSQNSTSPVADGDVGRANVSLHQENLGFEGQKQVTSDTSGSLLAECEVKPVYVSAHQQSLVSQARSPAPVSLLPTNCPNSPSTEAEREAGSTRFFMGQQNSVSKAHMPVPSETLLPMRLQSSVCSVPDAEENLDSTCISSSRQQKLPLKSFSPARPLPTISKPSSLISELEGEGMPAYPFLHLHETASLNNPTAPPPPLSSPLPQAPTSPPLPPVPPPPSSTPLPPPRTSPPMPPLPTSPPLPPPPTSPLLPPQPTSSPPPPPPTSPPLPPLPPPPPPPPPLHRNPDPPLSPEEGELKPLQPYVSKLQPTMMSVSSVATPRSDGELRPDYDPAHHTELLTPRQRPSPVKVSLPKIDLEQVSSPGEEGELKLDDVPVPQSDVVSPRGSCINVTTGDGSRRTGSVNVDPARGPVRESSNVTRSMSFSARGSGQLVSPGNASLNRNSSFVANQGARGSQFLQQSRLNSSNGGRHTPGPKDRGQHGVDLGSSRSNNTRVSWNRQGSFGRDGGSSRPHTPKGQRICKFYESGYCKKGASCNYLHP